MKAIRIPTTVEGSSLRRMVRELSERWERRAVRCADKKASLGINEEAIYWKAAAIELRAAANAVRQQRVGRPLAETSARTRDWQVLTILPGGWIDIDCNSGEERFVPRRTNSEKRPTDKMSH